MSLHENALRALDHSTTTERSLQVVVFGEAVQNDIDRALDLRRIAVGDVGKDSAFGGFVDEGRVAILSNRAATPAEREASVIGWRTSDRYDAPGRGGVRVLRYIAPLHVIGSGMRCLPHLRPG